MEIVEIKMANHFHLSTENLLYIINTKLLTEISSSVFFFNQLCNVSIQTDSTFGKDLYTHFIASP